MTTPTKRTMPDKEDVMPDMPKEVADMVKKAKDSVDAMFELAEVVQGVEKNSFKVNKRVSEMIDFLLNDLGMSMGVVNEDVGMQAIPNEDDIVEEEETPGLRRAGGFNYGKANLPSY